MKDASNRQVPAPMPMTIDTPDPVGSIDVGFDMDTSFDAWNISNNQFERPPVDRHIAAAKDPAVNQGGATAPPAGRFASGPDRHIL